MFESNVTRRDLVKGAAAAGVLGGTALAAAPALAQPAVADDVAWDKEADVVVIGYGGAGAAAAITAHDAGAEVLILEKMSHGGGNTAVSGGGVLCPTSAEDTYTYITGLFDLSHSEMDEQLVRTFSDKSVECVDWLCNLKPGTEMAVYGGAGFKQVEGSDSQQKYGVVSDASDETTGTGHTGADLFAVYTYGVDERGIEVLYSTPAQRLLTNPAGEVVGCVATAEDGSDLNVKARKAVILTTGGYEYDPVLLQNNVKGYPIYALGNPGNTGDGVRMAQAVGADLWHMNGCSCPIGFKCDDFEMGFMFGTLQPSMIWVNKLGKRFVNEKSVETHAGLLAVDHFDGHTLDYNEIPSWRIYDEAARQMGKVVKCPAWSDDNLEEVEKGWAVQADTIAELAEKLGIDPDALTATVDKWNADIAAGEDTLFGRPIENVKNTAYLAQDNDNASSAPLATPPFYAVAQYPTLLNTQGGPRRNVEAQVLDVFGEPIPRLYSSGELGSLWGLIYQGGGNNAEALVFGRIAGENAAALENWDA